MSDTPTPAAAIPQEALAQLEHLKQAAALASMGKFRCTKCKQVHELKQGVCILARQNIIVGVCLKCAEHTAITLVPSGGGYAIRLDDTGAQPLVQPANIADVRAVEASKLSCGGSMLKQGG